MADFSLYIAEPSPLLLTPDNVAYPLVILPAAFDTAPPVVDQVSPPAGASVGRNTPLAFRLTDNNGTWALRELLIRFGGATNFEWVHDGTSFQGFYVGSTETPVTGGFHYSLVRAGGWPAGARVRLRLYVVDAGGNVAVVNV